MLSIDELNFMKNKNIIVYYINLSSAIERRERMERLLSQRGVHASRVEAVVIRSYDEVRDIYNNSIIDRLYTKTLMLGEIGCYLSHLKCMKNLLESGMEWGAIMEDDIDLSKNFTHFMHTDWMPNGVKFIKASSLIDEGRIFYREKKSISLNNGYSLIKICKPIPVGTQAYFIHRDAAKCFIEHFSKIEGPIDEVLFSPIFGFSEKYGNWSIFPFLSRELGGTSNIGKRSPGYGKVYTLRQFLVRSFYKYRKSLRKFLCVKEVSKFDMR